jgi:hypothetical protein
MKTFVCTLKRLYAYENAIFLYRQVSKYGAHIFHTNVDRVWRYVNRFSDWIPYQHKVKARVQDWQGSYKIVPVPPNQVQCDLIGSNFANIFLFYDHNYLLFLWELVIPLPVF